ncbi:cyclopropane-fatty-acyl-phospholipid synthase, partial [Mytilus galloprovincialis]
LTYYCNSMASDDVLREGVRTNLEAWAKKLDCGGDLEKQNHFKKLFIKRLQNSPVAIETDKANEQHYEVPTEFFTTVLGKRLKYSCCYWTEMTKTLEEAEVESLKIYCKSAKITDGLSV